ncbi:MAG: hypothetical protein ACP5UZ_07610 [Thermoplasmata archaeon]
MKQSVRAHSLLPYAVRALTAPARMDGGRGEKACSLILSQVVRAGGDDG